MLRMGERIRSRREYLNIQINDLAKSIGVTPSLISQIERAKAFPSIITLKKLAVALQTTVGNLIGENETYSNNPLVKFAEKKVVQTNEAGSALFLLSNHDQQKLMEPHLLVLAPESGSENIINHMPGQSFYHIVHGSIRFEVNNTEYSLQQGDSFYFNSSHNHTIVNTGKKEAMLLWVTTNPIQ